MRLWRRGRDGKEEKGHPIKSLNMRQAKSTVISGRRTRLWIGGAKEERQEQIREEKKEEEEKEEKDSEMKSTEEKEGMRGRLEVGRD